MKKLLRPAALVLALVLLAGGAYAAVSGDSLVSLSYLTQSFLPQAAQAGTQAANSALDQTYQDALSALDQARGEVLGGAPGETGLVSAALQPRDWFDGQDIGLSTGSGVLLLQGTATVVHNGAVVDVTDGTEVPSGGRLAANHRYLVGEDTAAKVTILSGWASMGVQGSYAVAGGKGSHTPFADVSQLDWFYAPVGYVYEHNLFSGMEEHRFGPSAPMTRAMLMTVLYQLAGAPANELASASMTLSDVPNTAWFAPYVKWGVSQGIASGTGVDTFSPNSQITREQVVVMLYSFASSYMGKSMGQGADLSGYQDQGKVSTWAVQAMSWAVANGVVSGSSNGGAMYLNPQYSANRAEVAAMLRAFAEKI